MPLLKPLFLLLDLISEESSPWQIAGGVVLGMYLGLTPALTLHYALLWVIFFLVRSNVLGALVSWVVFSILGLALTPLFDFIGSYLLTGIPNLVPIWASLYHSPIFPYTRFNNTVVMGSLVFCLCLTVPVCILVLHLISQYHSRFFYRITESSIARTWRRSGLYRLYEHSHNK